jgi:predicted AAA+ superfamily ATPase
MHRQIAPVLLSHLKTWRSVALMGARQVGKSHLLTQIVSAHPGALLSFDDPRERQEAGRDPLRYLEQRYSRGKYLLIDEAARVPEIFSAVKILVDRHGADPTGICLANSGNYLLLRKIKESLAGRVNLLSIYPLSWQEFGGYTQTPGLVALCNGQAPATIGEPTSFTQIAREREDRMLWGGMPLPSLNPDPESRILWARDYVRTYIMPLVMEQFTIRDNVAFEHAARLLMLQNGQFFNANRLAQHVGVSQPTLKSYASYLEAMMVVEVVPVFFRNLNKRLIKQPKIYVTDPLLFNQSLDNFSLQRAIEQENIGRIYEGFVFAEIKKTLSNYDLSAQAFTWRTQDQAEVDLVLSTPGQLVPLEVKWSTRLTRRDASGLLAFLEAYPDVTRGYIIYPGDTLQSLHPKILAIPDWWLLGCY